MKGLQQHNPPVVFWPYLRCLYLRCALYGTVPEHNRVAALLCESLQSRRRTSRVQPTMRVWVDGLVPARRSDDSGRVLQQRRDGARSRRAVAAAGAGQRPGRRRPHAHVPGPQPQPQPVQAEVQPRQGAAGGVRLISSLRRCCDSVAEGESGRLRSCTVPTVLDRDCISTTMLGVPASAMLGVPASAMLPVHPLAKPSPHRWCRSAAISFHMSCASM